MNTTQPFSLRAAALALAAMAATGCASMPIMPISYAAEVTQSLDNDRAQLRATGIGDKYEWAVADAQKAAIAKIAQSLVQSQDEKAQWELIQQSVYANFMKYVERADLKGTVKQPDGSTKVQMEVVVNRRVLQDDLVSQGVIKEQRQLLSEIQNPSIAVIADAGLKGKEYEAFALNHAAGYLTGRKFEVLDIEQVRKIQDMGNQMNMIQGNLDPMAQIALQIGSDIYLVVQISVEQGSVGSDKTIKGSASVKAFETTTARQLGAASGFSKNYAATADSTNKAIAEALSDAADKVLVNVMDYWKDDVKKGSQFLIQIAGSFGSKGGREARRLLDATLKKVAGEVKQDLATDQTLHYRVWFTGSNTDLLFALQDAVDKNLQGAELKSVSENRKLLTLQLQ